MSTNTEKTLETIARNLERLADGIEEQNQLLKSVVLDPAEDHRPARVVVGVADAVQTIEL